VTRPVFHDSWQSSAAWRARAALAVKGIDHDVRMYEIIGKPHRSAEFMAMPPQGTVPVLEIDGHVIPQSPAIIEYLEETRLFGLRAAAQPPHHPDNGRSSGQ
jgi:glutathione S-transferase